MRNVLKWTAFMVGGFVAVVVFGALVFFAIGSQRLDQTYDIKTAELTIPTDDETIARGEHLVQAVAICTECHGDDLAGDEFLDESLIGTIHAPNLTAGRGGIGLEYAAADWDRAVRHGVNPDDKGLIFMPSEYYNVMSDNDLIAIIAYLQSVELVEKTVPDRDLTPIATILVGTGGLDYLAARDIDHDERPEAPESGVSIKYGEYLANIAICKECHGDDLKGRDQDQGGAPAGPDLTQSGPLGDWEEIDFQWAMRTGLTPDQRFMSDNMPWKSYANMTDHEIDALWLYLQTLD